MLARRAPRSQSTPLACGVADLASLDRRMKSLKYAGGAVALALRRFIVCGLHVGDSSTGTGAEIPWNGYGNPGVGMMRVTVWGDVKHAGDYLLDAGTSLESVYNVVGGWG